MKKTLCLLCALIAIISASAALAESPFPDLVPEHPGAANTITIELNGEKLRLDFDTSPEYSTVEDGIVDASFYTYIGDDMLVELYLSFPLDIRQGVDITPDYSYVNSIECNVILGISTPDKEVFYFAGQMNGQGFPTGANYSVRFDAITSSGSVSTFTGSLSATMYEKDLDTGVVGESFVIDGAPFNFSISSEVAPGSTARPTAAPDTFRV